MEYTHLGRTGLKVNYLGYLWVSRVCLGAMSYGSTKWLPWVKEEEEALGLIKMAWDAGINFIDTANVYSNGLSERIISKAIKKFNIPRSRLVIATKVFMPVFEDDPSISPATLPAAEKNNCYNWHYREEEREMIQYLQDQGIAQVPHSPLNKGYLTRVIGESTHRSESDASKPWVLSLTDADKEIVDRVHKIAEKKDVSMAQVALAWLYSKPYVTSPIVGISKESHLSDAVTAISSKLTEDEVKFLEEPYVPRNLIPM
ncbi:aldo/keto reductase [Umbelopsis sp. PMI_123]|nr:aldo/keto reductase [Umbelopsis sp. PMI_123]